MASYSSVTGNLANAASAAYTIGQGLERSVRGDSRKVHFIQGKNTVIEFDAVVSEQHSQDAGPTMFPLEDGSSITDHVIVTPFELTLSGIISDSRLSSDITKGTSGGISQFTQEGITSASNLVLGPLGVLAAGAAAKYNPTLAALRGTTKPSVAAFQALNLLIAGNAAKGIMPSLFDVVTSLKRYPNMIMRSLQVPRDQNTGNGLVFNISLVQMLIVSPQTVLIAAFKNPAVSAHKEKLGEKEPQEDSEALKKFERGQNAVAKKAGIPLFYPQAG